jgi:hypothetical protein
MASGLRQQGTFSFFVAGFSLRRKTGNKMMVATALPKAKKRRLRNSCY